MADEKTGKDPSYQWYEGDAGGEKGENGGISSRKGSVALNVVENPLKVSIAIP